MSDQFQGEFSTTVGCADVIKEEKMDIDSNGMELIHKERYS